MVIRELLKNADKVLNEKGIEDSYNEAAVLFEYACGKSKTYIYTHMDERVNELDEKRFNDFVEKRSENMPVAYITGKAWFMSLELTVNGSTLIPRPETEELAEEVIRLIKDIPGERIDVLDICTGSGCIGLAAAYYDKRVNSVLCDLNPICVETAAVNSLDLELGDRVETLQGDLFKPVKGRQFDVITANPPYIPTGDLIGLMKDVREYEPESALDGGIDGLDFYREIAHKVPVYIKEGGVLLLEIGIGQSDEVMRLLAENGFEDISVKDDISGIPRIISAFI